MQLGLFNSTFAKYRLLRLVEKWLKSHSDLRKLYRIEWKIIMKYQLGSMSKEKSGRLMKTTRNRDQESAGEWMDC